MPTELEPRATKTASWKWTVCGLLFLATMLNYMDRQTLSQTIPDIKKELHLTSEHYGNLEFGFGMAFALGAILVGLVVDKVSVRVVYPAVLVGWSLCGIATAWAVPIGEGILAVTGWQGETTEDTAAMAAYYGFMCCRVLLGLFEAGQWPCAMVITQRILTREERTFGNSLLQSGASIGAILTPLVVQSMASTEPGSWRLPFIVIGAIGMLWLLPWFSLIGRRDLERTATVPVETPRQVETNSSSDTSESDSDMMRKILVAISVVVTINLSWHFYRAWMVTFLREARGYSQAEVNYFTPIYFIISDIGCLAVGAMVKLLADAGWDVHRARVACFAVCAGLTLLSLPTATVEPGWPLLVLLTAIGFGALGQFPLYYSLSQELSSKNQGKVTGFLSATTWIVTSLMHAQLGKYIKETDSFDRGFYLAGLAPLVALAMMAFVWPPVRRRASS